MAMKQKSPLNNQESGSERNSDSLTSGRLLAKNTVWNLVGQGVPLLVALFAFPLLISGLGTDQFGVLTLAWVIIGYFSLFDLGLGRALTKMVADKLGAQEEDEIPVLVWTAMTIMAFLGLAGALILGLLTRWLVISVLNIQGDLQSEAVHTFYLLAVSIPVVICTAGFAGILSALQRFDLLNAVRIPMGVFMYLGPLLVLPFSKSLTLVIGVLVLGRFVASMIYLLLCLHVLPILRHGKRLSRSMVKPLLRFGGWMTVSNTIGPLMVTWDRFLIGALLSVTAVAYYATPYEAVTKLWLIPIAIVSVLFPAFAVSYVQDRARFKLLFNRGIKYIFFALFPITLVMVVFAHEMLNLWLGVEFADNSYRVLQWLAIGVLINSMAQVPFALIQGAGRPDITAKIHLVELPVYLPMLWFMIKGYGIDGAAISWVARVSIDALFLLLVGHKLAAGKTFPGWRALSITLGVIMILVIGMISMSPVIKVVYLITTILGFIGISWFVILVSDERDMILRRLKKPLLSHGR